MLATVYIFIKTNAGNKMVIIQMQAKCLHLHRNEQPIFRWIYSLVSIERTRARSDADVVLHRPLREIRDKRWAAWMKVLLY